MFVIAMLHPYTLPTKNSSLIYLDLIKYFLYSFEDEEREKEGGRGSRILLDLLAVLITREVLGIEEVLAHHNV